jgi:hypothetical protein
MWNGMACQARVLCELHSSGLDAEMYDGQPLNEVLDLIDTSDAD